MTDLKLETVNGVQVPVMEPKRVTHLAAYEFRGTDGIKRHLEVCRLEDRSIGILIHTFWGGDDATPLKTEFCMSLMAAEYIFQMGAAIRMDSEYLRLPSVDVLEDVAVEG